MRKSPRKEEKKGGRASRGNGPVREDAEVREGRECRRHPCYSAVCVSRAFDFTGFPFCALLLGGGRRSSLCLQWERTESETVKETLVFQGPGIFPLAAALARVGPPLIEKRL